MEFGTENSLEDIEEHQAVLVKIYSDRSCIVVDKYGRWKYYSASAIGESEKYKEYLYCDDLELFDMILEDDKIPYQSEIKSTSYLLGKAINIKPFSFSLEKEPVDLGVRIYMTNEYYAVTGSGKERELIKIGSSGDFKRVKYDWCIMLMRLQLDCLDVFENVLCH